MIVPDTVGMTEANATTAITGAGLVLGTVTYACSDTVAAGDVISQTPAAGTSVCIGSGMDLLVSDGPCPVVLFQDDFDDGNCDGWTIVDEGSIYAPSSWSCVTGTMVQSSNIYGGFLNPLPVDKLGTYAYCDAGIGWTDYNVSLTISSDDNDAIGVMFRYQDPNNYYRFSWDQSRSYRRLVKKQGGVFTLLAEDSVPYVIGQIYQLLIVAQGTILEVFIDGTPIFSVTDNSISSGSIALYTWGNVGSWFDDILVE